VGGEVEGQQPSLLVTRRTGKKQPKPEFTWLRFLTGKKGRRGGTREGEKGRWRGDMGRGGRSEVEMEGGRSGSSRPCP
jgi:hypothetical protein